MLKKVLKPPTLARATSQPLFAAISGLLLVGIMLVGSSLTSRPAAASSQAATINRLETFAVGVNGILYHEWSDDNGSTWSGWASLGVAASNLSFVGTPAVVSSGPGILSAFAMDTLNDLEYNTSNNNVWSSWRANFPGTDGAGVCIPARSDCYEFTSSPAVASWGAGRMDLFMYGEDDAGSIALLHTWADQYTWSGTWEVLGTGLMQGNPAAVSWGSGRVDVFVRGGGNEMDHKWFDNGQWSSGWENLGGILTSSPGVTSRRGGDLVVFVRNTNNGISDRAFDDGSWGSWFNADSNTLGSSPTTATGPIYLNEMALDPSGNLVYINSILPSWEILSTPISLNPPALVFWNPAPPPPPPTPTPVPTRPRCTHPPCTVTP